MIDKWYVCFEKSLPFFFLFSTLFIVFLFIRVRREQLGNTYNKLKILLLFLAELCIVFIMVMVLNLSLFGAPSFSFRPVILFLRIAYASHFKSVHYFSLLKIGAFIVFVAIQFVYVFQAIRKAVIELKNSNTESQGSARWATMKELREKLLIEKNPTGIVLGQTEDAKAKTDETEAGFKIIQPGSRLISDDSSYHAVVMGATGSGKGVGVIMPTLFTWKESVIVVDPKGESYDICGGFRSEFSETYYFNPVDKSGRSCRINPLDFIPRDEDAVSEITNLAIMIHPDRSKEQPYWDDVPRMIEEMLLGHVLIKGSSHSIPEAADIVSLAQDSWQVVFQNILESYKTEPIEKDDPLYPLSLRVTSYAKQFQDLASGEQSDQMDTHMTTVRKDFSIYSSPDAAAVMKYSDFSIRDIVDGERPLSLFLCVPVKDLERIMPMFKMIYTLVLKSLLGLQQKHRHKLLLLLDEFSQFKKFEVVAEQIPFVRSFGIRIMAFIQSVSQLNEYYGSDGAKALLDNFQIKVFLKASAPETCEYFEKMLGRKTYIKKSASMSSGRKSIGVDNITESSSEMGRSLLTAEEIMNLPGYDELIFRPNIHPYRAKKIQYFSDPRFKKLMNMEIQAPALPPYTHEEPQPLDYPAQKTLEILASMFNPLNDDVIKEPEDDEDDFMTLTEVEENAERESVKDNVDSDSESNEAEGELQEDKEEEEVNDEYY